MRRGYEADFDPDKMRPGEWAVSLDTKYVRMCFSPGVCVRMATYEAFEADMVKIQKILEECQTIEEAVKQIQLEIDAKEIAIEKYVQEAKAYSETASDEADRATLEADRAKTEADRASSIANIGIATTEKAGIVKPDGETIRVDADGTIHADNGTVDYNELENKPKINDVELSGSKSLSDLGIASADDLEETNSKVNIIIEKAELNIKNTASGENIHLTDSANGKNVGFGLYGKAEQKQYSGKNILDGIDATFSADNTTEKNISDAVHLSVGTYTLSWVQSATLTGNVLRNTPTIRIANDNSSKNYQDTASKRNLNAGRYYWTLKITEENDYVFGYWMHSPGVDVTISNIQLESGSVMTDFEPFTNGASPNPDYPQDIVVAGSDGSVEIVSCGKNLLKNTATSKTVNGVTFTVNEDGSVTVNGTATAMAELTLFSTLNITGEYILSGCPSGGGNKTYRLFVKTDGTTYFNNDGGEIKITPTRYIDYVRIQISSGQTVSNLVFYPMIRLASDTDDTYEPYKESKAIINGEFAGIKVSSGGNYTDENGQQWIADEIVKYADGSGQRIQRVGKAVFDGSSDEGWLINTTSDNSKKRLQTNSLKALIKNTALNTTISTLLCDKFIATKPQENYNATNGIIQHNGSVFAYSDNFNTDDVTLWTTYLAENPMTLCYELATPIITDLTAEEIAEIEKLHTFYPITNIFNDSDCGMSVTYIADSKLYIDNQLAIQKAQQEEALATMLLLMPEEVQASMIENDTNNLLNESEV